MERKRREYITGIPEAVTGLSDFVKVRKMLFNSSTAKGTGLDSTVGYNSWVHWLGSLVGYNLVWWLVGDPARSRGVETR